MKTILLACLALTAAGCTTIQFDNGPATSVNKTKTAKWHHNVAFSLYELSKPVNLSEECAEKEWVSVKTEQTFINGLASTVANSFGPIWYPKTVEIECKK